MPKKAIFKKEHIFNKAFEMFEKQGLEVITARNLAKALDASPAPIYSCYDSMDALKLDLINKAKNVFMDYVKKPLTELVFLNVGIGICAFAREEKQLFTSIFLKEKSYKGLIREFRNLIRDEMEKDSRFANLPTEFKYELFLDCWIFAHGFATLIATGYFEDPNNEFIKERLISGPVVMLYKKLEDFEASVKK